MELLHAPKRRVAGQAVLWVARLLTIFILGVWGFFLVAHMVGDAGASARPLRFHDYASLMLMIASLLGLGVALKWERLGAAVSLVSVAVGAMFNGKILSFPPALIPLAAALFLIHSCLRGEEL